MYNTASFIPPRCLSFNRFNSLKIEFGRQMLSGERILK
jgi:hypothetical protein